MNQEELIHAGRAHREQPRTSLLDAYQADVRDSVLLEAELRSSQTGAQQQVWDQHFENRRGSGMDAKSKEREN